jgi:tripartite ATP-independent transporter DctM subunit
MSPLVIGLIGLVIVLALIFLRMPIAVAMFLVGFLGIWYMGGWKAGISLIGSMPFNSISYALVTLPLFILMGGLLEKGGIADDLFYCTNRLLGGARGRLAIATILASSGFAAVSGSSMATVATIGRAISPEMEHYKKNLKMSQLNLGAVAAGGCLGILIPPSGIMIIYGVMVEASIGKLFMAGIVPGVIEALFFILTIFLICSLNPSLYPRGQSVGILEKLNSLKKLWTVLALFILIIGGIYAGLFSPTEAAGIGAIGAFIVVWLKGRVSKKLLKNVFTESTALGIMIMVLIAGAHILGAFIAMTGLPNALANLVVSFNLNPVLVIVLIMVMYLILGSVMDSMAMLLLTVPILSQVVVGLGYDIIWFGVLVIIAMEMAQITPPIGINVFILKAIYPEFNMSVMFKGILPFLMAQCVLSILLILYPQIALFLPSMM